MPRTPSEFPLHTTLLCGARFALHLGRWQSTIAVDRREKAPKCLDLDKA